MGNIKKVCFTTDFTDFKKEVHTITLVGISCIEQGERVLKIGYSICNPNDNFNQDLAIQIAESRARIVLYIYDTGIIDDGVVSKILSNKAHYIIEHIDSYIKGYSEAEERYLNKKAHNDLLNSLDDEEKLIFNIAKEDPEKVNKLVKLAEQDARYNRGN